MLIILLLSFRVSLASAEGVIGVDLLALQHPLFPLEKIISDVPNGSALGVLLDTFGEDRSKISKTLNSGKFSSFRIHLANGPGLRNGQLGIYENLSGLNIRSFEKKIIEGDHILESSFIERAKYVNKLALQFSNAKCYISPVLEHNLSPEAFLKLSTLVQQVAPNCQIVNNPVKGQSYKLNAGQILEIHGIGALPLTPYIASQDGDFGHTDDFLRFHNAALIKFVWHSNFNCRTLGKFIDPRTRTNCG